MGQGISRVPIIKSLSMKFLICLSLFLLMSNKKFEVMPVSKLKKLVNAEPRDLFAYDEQLKHSNALVYYLKSGQVILMPNNLYDKTKGILFENKSEFNKFLAIDSFPIENENPLLEESFQSTILNINQKCKELEADLAKQYKINGDSEKLSELLIAARDRLTKSNVSDREAMHANLLLGEYLRKSIKGKWILLKQYGTFNPYYVPGIIANDNSIVVLRDISNLFFNTGQISLENFLKLPSVKNPTIKLDGTVFKNNYVDYRILE